MDILTKVLKTIKKYNMIEKNDKVILAVSGGPDSIAMLYLMNELHNELECSLHVAHLDHCLRGEESEADAEFVKEQASKLNIPITIEKLDVKNMITDKESLESGARRIRYDFFKKVMSDVQANKVAQGHTADDQAETVLMRLLRGSGTRGLGGIPPIRDNIYIRPLIEISRKEVEAYLLNINVQPRWDSSNLSTEYDRNRIRHELIPILESRYCPNIKSILQQTAEILRTEDEFLDTLAREAICQCVESDDETKDFFKSPLTSLSRIGKQIQPAKEKDKGGFLKRITIQTDELKKYHISIQRRIIRIAIESILGDLNRYEFHHIEEIMSLVKTGKTGSFISLPRGIIAEKSYGKILIKFYDKAVNDPFDFIVNVPGETEIPCLGLKITTSIGKGNVYSKEVYRKTFDYDVIEGEIHLRNRREGDRFQPLGMSSTKKLKEYLIDEKAPRSQRDRIPILTDGNKIMWVIGYNIDDRFKVTTQTKTHLNVTVSFLQPPDLSDRYLY